VHTTVYLNDKPVFMAIKISDKSSDGVLASKFQPSQLAVS
jgi:hypothetical protein